MLLGVIVAYIVISNVYFLFRFFKSTSVRNKIYYQTTPSFVFWLTLFVSSFAANAVYSSTEAFMYDLLILTTPITILSTFVMGIPGAKTCYHQRNGLYLFFSILSLLMIALPVGLVIFPLASLFLRYLIEEDKRKEKKLMKQKKKAATRIFGKENKESKQPLTHSPKKKTKRKTKK